MKTFMFVRPCAQGRGDASLTGHARAFSAIVERRKMVVGAPGKKASIWREKSGYNINPLNPTVLCVPQHQTIVQSKMTLASGRVLQFQCRQKSSYSNLQNNAHNTYKAYNSTNSNKQQYSIFHADC